MTRGVFRTLFIVLILVLNISCDQVSKMIVRREIESMEQISMLQDHLTLTRIENKGAFLSTGDSWPDWLRIAVLVFVPVTALTLALVYVFQQRRGLSQSSLVGYSFIIGGGIGNLYDRILHGSVTDFMHIDFVLFETGIFNMADVSIMTGFRGEERFGPTLLMV
jgi:signal peptidase II